MRASRVPALVLLLWATSTLWWWAFAFAPLPSRPPAWLAAARSACFGAVESGLPAFHGWLLLVLGPASFLAGIVALWGSELAASCRDLARSAAGAAIVAALLGAVVVEGVWVSARLRAAGAGEPWDPATAEAPAPLPPRYPRQTAIAPDFALVDQHGAEVSLRGLQGRPVIVTFVFAHCQALCPVVVETLKSASAAGGRSAVLLVTLDPWRDTPPALPALARQWALPPSFHVLSSRNVERVLRVARAYDVPFERNAQTGDIVHPGLVFVIDPQGRIAYTFNNPPAAWIRDGLDRLG